MSFVCFWCGISTNILKKMALCSDGQYALTNVVVDPTLVCVINREWRADCVVCC